MDIDRSLLLMLLADARLPVAGHTQSAGLEPAVRAGLARGDVPSYLAARLRSVVRVEAGTAVAARAVLLTDGDPTRVATAWAARTPSPALRASSRVQARALLRIARRLWPASPYLSDPSGVAALSGLPRAVALGAVAATVGLSGRDLALLVGYDDAQTVAAAALKLLPLDPAEATCWVHDALPAVAALADDVGGLAEPAEIPATGAPQIEAWAQAHATTARRLFSA